MNQKRDFLKEYVDTLPVKAAITYIVGPSQRDLLDLIKSLQLLDENFNKKFQYPVILFNETFDTNIIDFIADNTSSPLFCIPIEPKPPEHLKNIPTNVIGSSIGYRNMIRWCAYDFANHPTMQYFDWAFHIDSDSELRSKIDYDIFQFMANNNYLYGYRSILQEPDFACVNFWPTVKKYIQDNDIKPCSLDKHLNAQGDWNQDYFYADFEISNLNFWRMPLYTKFVKYIDDAGGIYYNRWGDTLIHSLAVWMFLEKKQIHHFTDFCWSHQGRSLEIGK